MRPILPALLALMLPLALHAQTPAPAASPPVATAAAGAPQPSASTTPGQPAAQQAQPITRASWLNDRRPLRVGDILTVVVDEQTAAREQVSTDAKARRAHALALNAGDPTNKIGPVKTFSTSSDANSLDAADARRQGDLTAVIAVRVVSLDPLGNARVEGAKTVSVDGRNQDVRLTGVVRPEDVSPEYLVFSSRIAEATISYKGKKIGPRMGIIGKILSILWP